MTFLKFVLLFLLISLYSCGQKKYHANPEATRLNNKIISLTRYIDNTDSCKKALSFLDSATTIDSNCFTCYYNKLMFLTSLKQYDKAILTINCLIRLKPLANDLYMTGGVFYKKIGDTISSNAYFQKSLTICNSVLDTLNTNDRDHDMLIINKGIDIIILGDQVKGKQILKQLYDRQTDSTYKEYIASFMNKSKEQLLNFSLDNNNH
jgi:hypothetical protein